MVGRLAQSRAFDRVFAFAEWTGLSLFGFVSFFLPISLSLSTRLISDFWWASRDRKRHAAVYKDSVTSWWRGLREWTFARFTSVSTTQYSYVSDSFFVFSFDLGWFDRVSDSYDVLVQRRLAVCVKKRNGRPAMRIDNRSGCISCHQRFNGQTSIHHNPLDSTLRLSSSGAFRRSWKYHSIPKRSLSTTDLPVDPSMTDKRPQRHNKAAAPSDPDHVSADGQHFPRCVCLCVSTQLESR